MQKTLFVLLTACGISTRTRTSAESDCSTGTQSTITRFEKIYSGLTTVSDDDLPVLDNYTDRQLGIFRFSRHIRREQKRFTLAPLHSGASIVSVASIDEPSSCTVALVVPDPFNKRRVFMTTIHITNFVKIPYKGFDENWVNAVVTNSTEGRFNFFLCDRRESITLEPFVGNTTMVQQADRHVSLLNLPVEWIVRCSGEDVGIRYFLKTIAKFHNRKQVATPRTSIIEYTFWLLGAILAALLTVGLVMKCVSCVGIMTKLKTPKYTEK